MAFDRAYLTELAAEYLTQWPEETLTRLQTWLAGFMRVIWITYYNPAAYRDAGIEDPYEAQRIALASSAQQELRQTVSEGTVKFFLKIGPLCEVPSL